MTTKGEKNEFAELMVSAVNVNLSALDNAIEFISENLEPDAVFGDKKLQEWAESNGYTKE